MRGVRDQVEGMVGRDPEACDGEDEEEEEEEDEEEEEEKQDEEEEN